MKQKKQWTFLSIPKVAFGEMEQDKLVGIKSAPILSTRKRIVTEDFLFYVDGEEMVIPKGFIYDGLSVPRIFWWIASPYASGDTEAAIHDFLYFTGFYSRKISDYIFLGGLRGLDKSFYIRFTLLVGVRLFGTKAYNDHRKKDKDLEKKTIINAIKKRRQYVSNEYR